MSATNAALVEQVLAAIEEREEIARDASAHPGLVEMGLAHPAPSWTAHPIRGAVIGGRTHWVLADKGPIVTDAVRETVAIYVAYNDPATVLRACEADRRTVERHMPSWPDGEPEYSYHDERTESGQWASVRNGEPDTPYYCLRCSDFWPCADFRDRAAAYSIGVELHPLSTS